MSDFPGQNRTAAVALPISGFGYAGLGTAGSELKELWEYKPEQDEWAMKQDFPGDA